MNYYCNPINMEYKYQFYKRSGGKLSVSREAADPSLICFKGRYYLFPSMTCGFLYSDDLAGWSFQPLKSVPGYDYAPDVRVVGDYIYFCASSHEHGDFYRSQDPFRDDFEKIKGPFPFWDPNLFLDEDGRMYFYWGCGPAAPIKGVELNPEDLTVIGPIRELIFCDEEQKGFERKGENHVRAGRDPARTEAFLKELAARGQELSAEMKKAAHGYIMGWAYIEGAWMTKHNGRYYLQYAAPGTETNVYLDAVYVGDRPLGPFTLAPGNPFSYKPGGFIPGAGHGSTLADQEGAFWHTATMRISVNHNFERRLGIWAAGFDRDGELFCNQRYGDWPVSIEDLRANPWREPKWMLLSYGKTVKASSHAEGKRPALAVDENIRTWWRAAANRPGEWLEVDLGIACTVHAIQINLADDGLVREVPADAAMVGGPGQERWIDEVHQPTRWRLEGSVDGREYCVIADKSAAMTDLPHDLIVKEAGLMARFVRLTVFSLPYGQAACVSGLRIFGRGQGEPPEKAGPVTAVKTGPIDMEVTWTGNGTGYEVLWGHRPDKLYHSYQVFGHRLTVGGLIRDQELYVRVDSFNENGITAGEVIKVTGPAGG